MVLALRKHEEAALRYTLEDRSSSKYEMAVLDVVRIAGLVKVEQVHKKGG